jgi:hypothetical protein
MADPIVVRIELRNVYGKTLAYPMNAAAEHLAAIARTRTLPHAVLLLAEVMGMTVNDVHGRDWMAAL